MVSLTVWFSNISQQIEARIINFFKGDWGISTKVGESYILHSYIAISLSLSGS